MVPQFMIPNMRGLLQAVECPTELTYMIMIVTIYEPIGLNQEYIPKEMTMYKCVIYI